MLHFKFKQKINSTTSADRTNIAKIMMTLKYLSNLRRTLEMTLTICETNLKLILSKNCIMSNAAANQSTEFNW